jgi:hypothetical protein
MMEDCKVKVSQLDCTSVGEEDVLQLDIPVCHAHSVHGSQRVQQGRSDLRGGSDHHHDGGVSRVFREWVGRLGYSNTRKPCPRVKFRAMCC